ncbi:hypothetical protein BEWA_012400 [Theileria equi strain WA]|uniref:SHSP domain-containing protein n=1 Tax=Theileria equi strain WA TaxID=1537102 RepID=L1LBH0_THEEQ|nr:hypothetical protein BEWA_012400 [Theileria equi strain WA]EKX72681.1 hypothetical protein BEWA_012400 [Theileria equi strain WA]|eukprot:XP_004832133.1 hypothetical protein BEWA_012400 [Theileria equi strain WA]
MAMDHISVDTSPSPSKAHNFRLPFFKCSLLDPKSLYNTEFPRKYHFYNPFCYSSIILGPRNYLVPSKLDSLGTEDPCAKEERDSDAFQLENRYKDTFFGDTFPKSRDNLSRFFDDDYFKDLRRFINGLAHLHDSSFGNDDYLRFYDPYNNPFFGQGSVDSGLSSQTNSDPSLYKLEVRLPNVRKENIKIKISNDTLEISASSRHEDVPVNDENNHMTRRLESNFYQSVRLPPNLDLRKAKASFINDSIVVKIPKV